MATLRIGKNPRAVESPNLISRACCVTDCGPTRRPSRKEQLLKPRQSPPSDSSMNTSPKQRPRVPQMCAFIEGRAKPVLIYRYRPRPRKRLCSELDCASIVLAYVKGYDAGTPVIGHLEVAVESIPRSCQLKLLFSARSVPRK